MTRATRAGLALAGFLLVVLGASGAWLWWNYRPDRDQWIRTVHQVAAVAMLVVAVALLVLAIVRRARVGASGIVAAVGVFVTIGAAYVLGRLLAWDSLALHAVVSDVAGVAGALDPSVAVIAIEGRQVSRSTYEVWAWSHVGLSVLAVLALVMVWLRARDGDVSRRPRPTPAPAPAPAPEPAG